MKLNYLFEDQYRKGERRGEETFGPPMRLTNLFESNLHEEVTDLLIKYDTYLSVEYPSTHWQANYGMRHIVSDITQEIISHTLRPSGMQFHEKYQQRMDETNHLVLTLHKWRYDGNKFGNDLEAIGCSFIEPPSEPQFHVDDQFSERFPEGESSEYIKVDANSINSSKGPVTWWPPEALQALYDFRISLINKVKQELTYSSK
jgi:hypothetical protein